MTIEPLPIRHSSFVNRQSKGGTVRSFRYVAFLLVSSSALVLPAMSQVRPPTITSVSPAGFQRGNTITLTVEGANLADANAIQFSHPGLKGQITNVIELPYQP